MTEAATLGHHVAVGVLEHCAGGCCRGSFPVVDCRHRAAIAGREEHEPATADIAGPGLGHRQGKTGGDCSVHGVAAVFEDLQGHP